MYARYINVTVLPEFSGWIGDVYSMTTMGVHLHNSRCREDAKNKVAVSYPEYVAPQLMNDGFWAQGSLGNTIQIFGSDDSLNTLISILKSGNLRLSDNRDLIEAISVSEINAVKSNRGYIAFTRSRDLEKSRVDQATRDRFVKRFIAKHRVVPDKSIVSDFVASQKKDNESFLAALPRISVFSLSSGDRYQISVEKIDNVGFSMTARNPDSYGFSSKNNPCAIPVT